MTKHFAAFWITAVLAIPTLARAHEGHAHNVMGTVTMVAADHVMVKTADGKDVTMKTTNTTKVVQGKATVKLADVKVGVRVVIVPESEKESLIAREIQVGNAGPGVAPAVDTHSHSADHK